jgi:hypothetical protein
VIIPTSMRMPISVSQSAVLSNHDSIRTPTNGSSRGDEAHFLSQRDALGRKEK